MNRAMADLLGTGQEKHGYISPHKKNLKNVL